MKGERTYDMPYVGCLVGMAFQKMTSRLEQTLKKEDIHITAAEYMILRALYFKDGLQQCELSEMIGKDKSSICRSVGALIKKEYLRPENVSYKCIRVWLTDKSLCIKPKIMAIAERMHQSLFDNSSQSDIKSFIKVLKEIVKD